jgi:hypothetical protein
MASQESTPLTKVLMKLKTETQTLKEHHTKLLEMNREVYRLGKDIRETNETIEIAYGLRESKR